MSVRAPHFLLFSEARQNRCRARAERGEWRFVLESVDGPEKLEAVDTESDVQGERLELLAVVRGLEALNQPSRVTLVTRSRYVARGFRYGLNEWRETGWKWEHFGHLTEVNNHDLWQRIDQAMNFHDVECRTWRFDAAHVDPGAESESASDGHVESSDPASETADQRDASHAPWTKSVVGRIARLLKNARTRHESHSHSA